MAEQVEFELSVLFGESGANTDRLIRPIGNSNSRYGSRKLRRWLGRIKSESEPPNLPTEINAGCGVFLAQNPRSLVRMQRGASAKTPRNRGDFSDCARVRARSLCNARLVGGESGIRTHGTFQYTRFPSVRLKPLGHLSVVCLLSLTLSSIIYCPVAGPGGEGGIRTLDRFHPIHP